MSASQTPGPAKPAGSGPGRYIGQGFVWARDGLARVLVRCGATPNRITVFGFLLTCGTGVCLGFGAGHQTPYSFSDAAGPGPASLWPLWAGLFLIASAACDMLDGAVARVGNLRSEFGAVLDSTLDRFSDIAIFMGCAAYFAWRGNVTYQLLAFIAVGNTFLISYIKARAEEVIPDCSVGWWQRGERYVALLLGCFFGHMPFVLWQLAILPAFTVWRRLDFARRSINAQEAGRPLPAPGPAEQGWRRWLLWHYPRRTWQFDVVAGFNISSIIVMPWIWAPLLAADAHVDPLRRWLGG